MSWHIHMMAIDPNPDIATSFFGIANKAEVVLAAE